MVGQESYFIVLLDRDTIIKKINNSTTYKGASNMTKKIFIENLKKLSLKIKKHEDIYESFFIIEDIIVARIFSENDFFQGISFEGCFSWFEESLKLIIDIANKIEKKILNIRYYHPAGINKNVTESFLVYETFKAIYKEKYNAFQETFPEAHFKSLPGNKFFKKYNVKKFFMKYM